MGFLKVKVNGSLKNAFLAGPRLRFIKDLNHREFFKDDPEEGRTFQ